MSILLRLLSQTPTCTYKWTLTIHLRRQCTLNKLTFIKRWVAKEEIVAGSGWRLLASVWLENSIQSTLHFVDLIEDGEDTFLKHLVWFLFTQIEGLQINWHRLIMNYLVHGGDSGED